MNTEFLVISEVNFGSLCFIAGLGWGLFLTTLVAAFVTYNIRWGIYSRTGK